MSKHNIQFWLNILKMFTEIAAPTHKNSQKRSLTMALGIGLGLADLLFTG